MGRSNILSSVDSLAALDISSVTGMNTPFRFVATRYLQGGRVTYSVDLPLEQVPDVLPMPDPARPTPGNRRVNEIHAKSFGRYVRETPEWVAPPLLIRDPGECRFERQINVGGMEIGILSVPRSARLSLKIIDGQHRILGVHLALRDLQFDLDRLGDARARERDEHARAELDTRSAQLAAERARFADEHFSLQIYVEDQPAGYEQMFFDVADNALGINQAIKVRFDSRKTVNRTLEEACRHALLRDRVDLEQDRITGPNQNLVGAKHVADFVRTIEVGVAGRIGRKVEEGLDEGRLVERFNNFMDVLVTSFGDLTGVADGTVSPADLRARSLLGSITMLRVLAGAYHNLSEEHDDDEIAEFFALLDPHMVGPVSVGSIWLTETAEFALGALGPNARAQSVKQLTATITGWMNNPPAGL